MYTSLRAIRPLSTPAFRRQVYIQPSFKRVISTSSIRFAQNTSDTGTGSHNDRYVEHQNRTSTAREELRNVGKDVAEMIAGGSTTAAQRMSQANEISSHGHAGSITEDFRTMTKDTFASVPRPAMVFGLAGTIPYLGTSLGTIILAREASRASQGLNTVTGLDLQGALDNLHVLEQVQITYGAIILSFLGAIHWGMEFSKLGGEHGYKRLAIGVVPVLFAWPTTFLPHGIALVAQWFGFTGTWMIDQRASQQGWTTSWYSTYRFYLSIVVGLSIMATFAGTGSYGAGAGASTAVSYPTRATYSDRMSGLQRLDKVGEKNRPSDPNAKVGRVEGKVKGDIEAVDNDESYVKFRNVKEAEEAEAEAAQKRKEEQEKKQAEQDKKDEHQQKRAPGDMKDTAKDRTGNNDLIQDDSQKK